MERKIKITLLALLALTLTGCGSEESQRCSNQTPNLIYRGYYWDIVKLNDSIVVCTPGLNGSSKSIPVVINLHDPDCPCREKGASYD